MQINEVEWHDGVISRVDFNLENQSVTFYLSVYKNEREPNRSPIKVVFKNVQKLNANCDVEDLLGNAVAGNVDNLYIKEKHTKTGSFINKKYVLYRLLLNDGLFEIVSENIYIEEA